MCSEGGKGMCVVREMHCVILLLMLVNGCTC